MSTTPFQQGDLVLFQGDSITDCGRNRDVPGSLGGGYALMIAGALGSVRPERQLRFLNRGISGNRTGDLRARWKVDCLDLEPAWLSLLIGVNDTWRAFDSDQPTATETFRDNLQWLLDEVPLAGDHIVLMTPFTVPCGVVTPEWEADLGPKIEAVKTIGKARGARVVDLQSLFASSAETHGAAYWAGDGVHPTAAGHGLIARAWLAAVDPAFAPGADG